MSHATRRGVDKVTMYRAVDREMLVTLLRSAMRQWAAFVEIQIAIETAVGVDGASEVRDYVESLAPEFIDCPNSLTVEHAEHLLELCGGQRSLGMRPV